MTQTTQCNSIASSRLDTQQKIGPIYLPPVAAQNTYLEPFIGSDPQLKMITSGNSEQRHVTKQKPPNKQPSPKIAYPLGARHLQTEQQTDQNQIKDGRGGDTSVGGGDILSRQRSNGW